MQILGRVGILSVVCLLFVEGILVLDPAYSSTSRQVGPPISSQLAVVSSWEEPKPHWTDWFNAQPGRTYAARLRPNGRLDFLERATEMAFDGYERSERYRLFKRVESIFCKNTGLRTRLSSDHGLVDHNFGHLLDTLRRVSEARRFQILGALEEILNWPIVDRDFVSSPNFPATSCMRRIDYLTTTLAETRNYELLGVLKSFVELTDEGSLIHEMARSILAIEPSSLSSIELQIERFRDLVGLVYREMPGTFLSPSRERYVGFLEAVRVLYGNHPTDADTLMELLMSENHGDPRNQLDVLSRVFHAIANFPAVSAKWAETHDFEEFRKAVDKYERKMDAQWEDFLRGFSAKQNSGSRPERTRASDSQTGSQTAHARSAQPKKDIYQLLGLDRSASEKELRKAFNRAARLYHPDLNPNRSKEEQAKYSELFDVLMQAWSRRSE